MSSDKRGFLLPSTILHILHATITRSHPCGTTPWRLSPGLGDATTMFLNSQNCEPNKCLLFIKLLSLGYFCCSHIKWTQRAM